MKKFLSVLIAFVLTVSAAKVVSLEAFAESDFLSSGKVVTSGGRLNVRSAPSTSGRILARLNNGNELTLIEKEGGWWHIQYSAGGYGYVSADYIKENGDSFEAVVATAGGNLNIRSGRGTGYSVKAKLKNKSRVIVTDTENNWSRILYNGTSVGYVSSNYLKKLSNDIILDVPSFKQRDSRWSDIEVGNSGKDIGKIGCALTCLSMTESYRLNRTVYPSETVEKLNFSSDGSLYWYSNYRHNYEKNYLENILELLKQNKPVILCARTYAGSTHFVVVTGYNENGSLSADDFLINDPGSKYRDTLDDHLRYYPVFSKIVYYV